jgi:hypothetical protein
MWCVREPFSSRYGNFKGDLGFTVAAAMAASLVLCEAPFMSMSCLHLT